MVITARLPKAASIALLIASLLLLSAGSGSTAATAPTSGTAAELLAGLEIAPEHSTGYQRTLFRHWIDADEDGCSTRAEVLIVEARGTPEIGDDCAVSGSWRSAYDGVITSYPGTFDIDHVVPLKEAWESGAWAWTPALRERFANDLGDWRVLRAVTAATNRSKGDKDPANWLPPRVAFRCTYVRDWIAVKVRWSLRVDAAERTAIETVLGSCANKSMTVNVLSTETPAPSPTPTSSPPSTPSPTSSPMPVATPSGGAG